VQHFEQEALLAQQQEVAQKRLMEQIHHQSLKELLD
jgi:hypothetical protein